MRFMIIRKTDAVTEAGIMPAPELFTAMGDYMEQMAKAGVMLAGDGLKASSTGKRVTFHKGEALVTDGPFAETKEMVAGYIIIDVPSLQEAVSWAKKWPPLDSDGEVRLEVRPFFEADDFGDVATAEEQARSSRLRANPAGSNG